MDEVEPTPATESGRTRILGRTPRQSRVRVRGGGGLDSSLSKTERIFRDRLADAAEDQERGEVVLGRYRLVRRLGAGGFGVVWLAHDEKLKREVAIKAIPREGDDDGRAEREALAVARLNHPGIVALYELGSDSEFVYLVSELVRGRTLSEVARAGALSDRDVARIGAALCDALAHAHERGVIHRDIKPQNVLVARDPAAGAGFAKLADFGIAHVAGGDPLTHTGDVVGTLAYMAPEQGEGQRVTPVADVYSLALTLYEGWTGSNPVRADSPAATARRLGRRLPPLGKRRRDLPAGLCAAIDRALEPDPTRRADLGELGRALTEHEGRLSDEGGLVEPGTLERLGLAARRGITAGGVLARAAAGLAAGGLVLAALLLVPGALPPFHPAIPAGAAAAAVSVWPRAAWLVSAAAVCAWISGGAELPGLALALALPLALTAAVLPRAGLLWSLPALAPLLAFAGLGPMFVAVAGLAGTAWRRAGLAAAGFGAVAIAEPVSGERLLFGAPESVPPRAGWDGSWMDVGQELLYPLVSTPALLPAAAWVALAVVLPYAVRGTALWLDVIGGAIWAGALIAAHRAIGDVLAGTTPLTEPSGVLAGAVLGLLLAVSGVALGARDRADAVADSP